MNRIESLLGALGKVFRKLLGSRIARLCIGLALFLGFCVKLNVAHSIRTASGSFDFPLAALGMAMTLVILALRAWRWNTILDELGRGLALSELTILYTSTFFLGLISPGRIGELARVWIIRERVPGFPAAAFSVAFDRACDIMPTLLLTVCFGPLLAFGGIRLTSHVLLLSILAVAAGLSLLVFNSARLHALVNWLVARFPDRVSGFNSIANSRLEISSGIRRPVLAKVLILSLLSQAALVAQTYLLARAVAMEINPLLTYAVVTVATVAASLPVSIGGIGTREITVVWALTSLGFSHQQAVSFSLLCLLNFIFTLIVSMIAFVSSPLSASFDVMRGELKAEATASATR